MKHGFFYPTAHGARLCNKVHAGLKYLLISFTI
jgi:hypothetical protein